MPIIATNTPDDAVVSSDDTDEDDMAVCPFNGDHKLLRHRMPYHIVRCRRNYRGPALVACAFNAMHLMPAAQMADHLAECDDYRKNQQHQPAVDDVDGDEEETSGQLKV